MVRTLDETKRSAILSAAKLIFVRDGIANSKMSDVAAEAGVAPGTLYLYFENKEALVGAIGEDYFARLTTKLIEYIDNIEGPDDIAPLVDWADKVAEKDHVMLAMAVERTQSPKRKTEKHKRKISMVAQPLQRLMDANTIRHYDDANVLAELLMSLMRRVIMSRALFGDENTDDLRAGTIAVIQRVLFDDVSVAASQLMNRKKLQ